MMGFILQFEIIAIVVAGPPAEAADSPFRARCVHSTSLCAREAQIILPEPNPTL